MNTSIGQVQILDITKIDISSITEKDALKSGFNDLNALIAVLNSRDGGQIYKVEVSYSNPDPRIELRNDSEITQTDFDKIKAKLNRLDKYSRSGNWTLHILGAIMENPKLSAGQLAEKTGKEKEWLKTNIRKLKNIGLTVSHNPGYTISPRGKIFMEKLNG
nr:hypothetical protein [uncultured Allomuricauda sp.]